VTGLSWQDHEFSTSALAANQVGWDWFALQLDDGSELKAFHIRQTDGSVDPSRPAASWTRTATSRGSSATISRSPCALPGAAAQRRRLSGRLDRRHS
jgi:predicted secreted hydrolase